MIEQNGESIVELEREFYVLEDEIKKGLFRVCKDPQTRVRIEEEHFVKVAKNESESSSLDALRLDLNGNWNGFNLGIDDVLETYALVVDGDFRYVYVDLEEEEIAKYITDPANRQRLLSGLVDNMHNVSDLSLWDRLMSL